LDAFLFSGASVTRTWKTLGKMLGRFWGESLERVCLPIWLSHISRKNTQTPFDRNGKVERVLIYAVTFLFEPTFDSLYRPISLFLLGSEISWCSSRT
jgi:hypothetical protein